MDGATADSTGIDRLYSAFYDDLHRLAHQRLFRNERITLLNTTVVVHESYLRFLSAGRLNITDRAEFLRYAAAVMRSVIVDFVRRRHAERRTQVVAAEPDRHGEEEIIAMNHALDELQKVGGRLASVVEMRYFGGLETAEIAEALGVTERTVRRDWEKARLLLAVALQ